MRFKSIVIFSLLIVSLVFTGCGTGGKPFDEVNFENIVNGSTTQKEVETMFGMPFKKGIQNGKEMWIYEYNKYRAIGKDTSKDMVIVFDESGVVKSHKFMTSQPASSSATQ